MKIYKFLQRVPAGIMVIPLICGAIVNTVFPAALQIGGSTTALLKDGTNCLMGLFLVVCGSSINIRQLGSPLAKGTFLTILKLVIAIIIGKVVSMIWGPEGVFGITPVVLIATLSNSSGAVYAALAGKYGDSTDVGAVSVLCINDGPFLTMVALGATGLANIPFMALVATAVPLLIGFIWGNLDEDFRKICTEAYPVVTIFFCFVLGSAMNIVKALSAGLAGLLLALIVMAFSGFLVTVIYSLVLRKKTALGMAVGTAAGNSVATPAAIANADPTFAPYAEAATAQATAASIFTCIFTPLLTAYLDSVIRKLDKKNGVEVQANVSANETA